MRASTKTGFGLAVVMMGLLTFGCSTQTDDARSDGATNAQPSAKETGGPAGPTASAFDLDDMLGFIAPLDCEADFSCPQPGPDPRPWAPPLPVACGLVCPVGTSLTASCECVDPWRGWNGWEN